MKIRILIYTVPTLSLPPQRMEGTQGMGQVLRAVPYLPTLPSPCLPQEGKQGQRDRTGMGRKVRDSTQGVGRYRNVA